jgi:hypothetical protein
MYVQTSKEMWQAGKSQSLGVKARFNRFRADAHQRASEKTVENERLNRTVQVVHKPFNAADLLLTGIEVKGICANFVEVAKKPDADRPDPGHLTKVSDLVPEKKDWFNFFDFIDADKKPFDKDPEFEVIDVMDCPHVFFSKRVKAKPITSKVDEATTALDDKESGPSEKKGDAKEKHADLGGKGAPIRGEENITKSKDPRLNLEASKFGEELSHICYLGAASGVAETQIKITKQRIRELEQRQDQYKDDDSVGQSPGADRA